MRLRSLPTIALLAVAASANADVAVYDLEAPNASEIADGIRDVLVVMCTEGPSANPAINQARCRSELLPTGQLVVAAPGESQAKIALIVKAIAERKAGPAPQVLLRYWVVSGRPGQTNDSEDPQLTAIASVIREIQRTYGDLRFQVEDIASLVTNSGAKSSSVGGRFQVNQEVRANGDSADVNIGLTFTQPPVSQDLYVDVTIKRGEYLVLGQRSTEESNGSSLFYIVQWPSEG